MWQPCNFRKRCCFEKATFCLYGRCPAMLDTLPLELDRAAWRRQADSALPCYCSHMVSDPSVIQKRAESNGFQTGLVTREGDSPLSFSVTMEVYDPVDLQPVRRGLQPAFHPHRPTRSLRATRPKAPCCCVQCGAEDPCRPEGAGQVCSSEGPEDHRRTKPDDFSNEVCLVRPGTRW